MDMERTWYKSETDGDALVYAKYKGHRIAPKIDGIRERPKGYEANQSTTVNVENSATWRERAEAKRIHDTLEEEE